ncbi:hypothetical protein GGD83_002347 [Rhodoblastus sphagnicola]|nr:transporter [Rhodoblastus sphagnicola]MBB4198546.1 hypothetical protein [Rhodoblastus sphagnicola]
MKINAKFAAALVGALTFSGVAHASIAGPTPPPGETAGLDLASPLPEGVYFVNIGSVGSLRSAKGEGAFDYNVPALVWSTPWNILGGRLTFLGAAPEVSLDSKSSLYARGIYNPLLAGQLRWNLGNGFSASYLAGAYIGITGTNLYAGGNLFVKDPLNETTFYQVLGLAWRHDGWNATANLKYGIVGDNGTSSPLLAAPPKKNADFFIYDLGLTKSLGRWELGVVAYGSTMNSGSYSELRSANFPYACSGCTQFALGGLVGYNFGPVITQLTVATDLYAHSDNNVLGAPWWPQKETRGVLRTIIPLWNPETPKAVAAKY